jgi:hypothetical protein
MEKKVYIAPAIELYEFETEGCLLDLSQIETGQGEQDAGGALSNKREPEAPWDKSPWE